MGPGTLVVRVLHRTNNNNMVLCLVMDRGEKKSRCGQIWSPGALDKQISCLEFDVDIHSGVET